MGSGRVMHWRLRVLLAALIVFSASSPALAARCTDYRSCEQVARAWCAGQHPRADGDGDGIPCENVCPSKRVVDRIRARIGC